MEGEFGRVRAEVDKYYCKAAKKEGFLSEGEAQNFLVSLPQ